MNCEGVNNLATFSPKANNQQRNLKKYQPIPGSLKRWRQCTHTNNYYSRLCYKTIKENYSNIRIYRHHSVANPIIALARCSGDQKLFIVFTLGLILCTIYH